MDISKTGSILTGPYSANKRHVNYNYHRIHQFINLSSFH